MCRVELKVASFVSVGNVSDYVPNVPCGVERNEDVNHLEFVKIHVPNVPCGVESLIYIESLN